MLLDDGRIIYHPSFHVSSFSLSRILKTSLFQDYENDAHGKEIILQRTTIKIPGSNKPRIALRGSNNEPSNDAFIHLGGKVETPSAKKRHRRLQANHAGHSSGGNSTTSKSLPTTGNGGAADDDADENVFIIVSLDKQWFFEAQSNDERDEWVQAIEQQILFSLQNIESSKAARAAKSGATQIADSASVQAIKQIPGNHLCADCDQFSKTTDSNDPSEDELCFDRSHLGFVESRSIDLYGLCFVTSKSRHTSVSCSFPGARRMAVSIHSSDLHSPVADLHRSDLVQVMRSIGNKLVNSIWEANVKSRTKPQSNASSSVNDEIEGGIHYVFFQVGT